MAKKVNPLDSMTWEQRFRAAFAALLVMERKYQDAMAKPMHDGLTLFAKRHKGVTQ